MKEARGNLWTLAKKGDGLVITTNGYVRRDGKAVMGRGIAREAALRVPYLADALGEYLSLWGNHCFFLPSNNNNGPWLLSMPVKHVWSQPADLKLIERSARELVVMADADRLERIWLPRPGCGNGRLSWIVVRPVIAPILDDRFIAVTK